MSVPADDIACWAGDVYYPLHQWFAGRCSRCLTREHETPESQQINEAMAALRLHLGHDIPDYWRPRVGTPGPGENHQDRVVVVYISGYLNACGYRVVVPFIGRPTTTPFGRAATWPSAAGARRRTNV